MRPLTSGTTAALGRQGLVGTLATALAVLATFMILALSPNPATLASRLAALSALTIVAPVLLGAVATAAAVPTGAHGARHWGGAPAPTNAEMVRAASSTHSPTTDSP